MQTKGLERELATAKQLVEQGMTMAEASRKVGVSEGTISLHANRDGWDTLATKRTKVNWLEQQEVHRMEMLLRCQAALPAIDEMLGIKKCEGGNKKKIKPDVQKALRCLEIVDNIARRSLGMSGQNVTVGALVMTPASKMALDV